MFPMNALHRGTVQASLCRVSLFTLRALGFWVVLPYMYSFNMLPCNPLLNNVPYLVFIILSVCVYIQVISIRLLSRTRGRVHRLRGDSLVPGPWAAGRGHSVRAPCGHVGPRLCFRRAPQWESTLAREVWRWPALPYPKDSRYTEGPRKWVLSRKNLLLGAKLNMCLFRHSFIDS